MEGMFQTGRVVAALVPATHTAALVSGEVIDTTGYESLEFGIAVGAFTTFASGTSWFWEVLEGDVADGSDMAVIPAGDYIGAKTAAGAAWDRYCDAAADDDTTFSIGVLLPGAARKRYRLLRIDETGTVSAIAGAVAKLGNARHQAV